MPLVTLLTDFGTADSYVAEMKGVLLTRAPGTTLVDVTHAIPPGDVAVGAYVLGRAWHRFPRGTVHLAVVDPGVGTRRAALALRAGEHLFVGPDNGLFTEVLHDRAVEIVTLAAPAGVAPTFHGRDLFAPAAAALARGATLPELGEPLRTQPVRLARAEPRYEGDVLVGDVIYVDRFGTLVTNLGADAVPPDARIEVQGLDLGPLRRTFGDVPSGALVAFPGSGGTIEIAVRDGSAAARLDVGVGGRVRARRGAG
ncbi:MAG TPA: SAM-dependent chlorinase/fluorinase [Gemmatimonadales bacterium]|nr:SAM-dependent chlorinase/fluorinase [Gemmatimonadales bacterium]